jgi:O-antigen/teichoic acid export membrane protein
MVLYLIVLAMNKAYVPILYEKLNSQDFHSVQKLAVKYSGIIYIAAVFLVLFTREIVMLLAGRQYYEGLGMVPLVVLCYCFVYLYTLYVNYSFYLKKTVSIAVSTLISGLINIGLNYMFIPLFGYYGAVYSSLFAFFFLFLFNFLNVRYFLKELQSISLLSVSKGLLFVLGAIIIFYTVDYYVGNIIFSLLIRVIYLAGVIYYFLRKRG